MSKETIEMPKSWPEKLEELEVGEHHVVDKPSTVRQTIHRSFGKSTKKFTVRKDKSLGFVGVWRIA